MTTHQNLARDLSDSFCWDLTNPGMSQFSTAWPDLKKTGSTMDLGMDVTGSAMTFGKLISNLYSILQRVRKMRRTDIYLFIIIKKNEWWVSLRKKIILFIFFLGKSICKIWVCMRLLCLTFRYQRLRQGEMHYIYDWCTSILVHWTKRNVRTHCRIAWTSKISQRVWLT